MFYAKKTLVCLAATLILMFSITISAFAAVRTDSVNEAYLIGLNDHGWTTMQIQASLNEYYDSYETTNNFYKHEKSVWIQSSRPAWDTPYNVSETSLVHRTVGGTIIRTFSCVLGSYIFPPAWYINAGYDDYQVPYGKSVTNYSTYSLGIFASGCLNPYGHAFRVELGG